MLLVLAAISSLASYLVIQNRQKSVKNDFTYLGSGKKGEVFFFMAKVLGQQQQQQQQERNN